MRLSWLVCAFAVLCAGANALHAQALIKNGLMVYYSFDGDFSDTITDGSGNGLDGQVYGTVVPEAGKRGGAANFIPSPTGDAPNFGAAAVDITANKANVPNFAAITPKEAFSFSAWVNVAAFNNSGSILQARSDQGSFVTHIQLEGSGALRYTVRGDVQDASAPNGGTIANKNPAFLDNSSEQYPLNEWFHFAGTYDSATKLYSLYYNGEAFFTDSAFGGPVGNFNGCDGVTAGTGTNRCEVGDIPSGALIGAVSDGGGRRFEGLMDEYYVFNRALSDTEVKALYDLTPINSNPTDLNGDGAVDAADAGIMFGDWGGPGSTSAADFNKDGFVDAADAGTMFEAWTGDPATPGAKAATAEYNSETGELKISSAGAVNVFVQSASNAITPISPAPAVPVGLLTNNTGRVGITNLGPIEVTNFSFGNIGKGLAMSDLKLVYTTALGTKGIEVPAGSSDAFKYIPEPASLGLIGLGLAGLLAARRRS